MLLYIFHSYCLIMHILSHSYTLIAKPVYFRSYSFMNLGSFFHVHLCHTSIYTRSCTLIAKPVYFRPYSHMNIVYFHSYASIVTLVHIHLYTLQSVHFNSRFLIFKSVYFHSHSFIVGIIITFIIV